MAAVDRPVNVLPTADTATVAELAAIGVRRISVGGSLYAVANAAVVAAATELRDRGTFSYRSTVPDGVAAARAAFST